MTSTKTKKTQTKKGGKTKRDLVNEIIQVKPKKRKKEPKLDNDIKPVSKGEKKPNLAHRAGLARHMNVTTQTVYNRERHLARLIPEYARGLSLLPKNGGALKELPDLTPYQQYCHLVLNDLRPDDPKDCTPNEMIIQGNLDAFDIALYKAQEASLVDIEVDSSQIEQVFRNL